jgi:hypothetical protein
MAAATGGHACGEGDGLGTDVGVGLLVAADVVDEKLLFLALAEALDEGADAGLARVVGREASRVGQTGLEEVERDDALAAGGGDLLVIKQANFFENLKAAQIVVAEAHPKAHGFDTLDVLRERVNLVVTHQIEFVAANLGKVVVGGPRVVGIGAPFPVLKAAGVLDDLAQVDLGIEVRRKKAAVAAVVHVHDVDGGDAVEFVTHGVGAVGVDDAGVESRAEDGGHSLWV